MKFSNCLCLSLVVLSVVARTVGSFHRRKMVALRRQGVGEDDDDDDDENDDDADDDDNNKEEEEEREERDEGGGSVDDVARDIGFAFPTRVSRSRRRFRPPPVMSVRPMEADDDRPVFARALKRPPERISSSPFMYKCAKCESCFEGEMDPASVDRCITYEGCYRYENLAVDGEIELGCVTKPVMDRCEELELSEGGCDFCYAAMCNLDANKNRKAPSTLPPHLVKANSLARLIDRAKTMSPRIRRDWGLASSAALSPGPSFVVALILHRYVID